MPASVRRLLEVTLFVAIVAAASWLWRQPVICAGAVTGCCGGLLLLEWSRTPKLWRAFLFGAVFGPAAEIVAVAGGSWTYHGAAFAGIPLWLPPAWGAAAMFFALFARRVGPGA